MVLWLLCEIMGQQETHDESEGETEQLENAKITTNGGQPAVELPNGERFTLDIQINRLDGEQIAGGDAVDFETEVCTDDFSWWHLVTDENVEVVITPQVGWHDVDG